MPSHTPVPRPRRRRGSAVAVIAGVALAVAAPLPAAAHVGVSPDTLPAADHGVLTFSFSHGCEGSPTSALRITMPEGLASVAPTMDGDWSIDVERGADGLVSAVTYTALAPVPDGLRGAVSMSVALAEDATGVLAFPVLQSCVEGSTEWSQLAQQGEDPHDLDAPAPVLTVAPAATGHEPHTTADDAESGPAASDPLAVGLATGGLLTGIAALIVAVLALRRRA